MCSRYYIDGETAKEVERLVLSGDEKWNLVQTGRDICPAEPAPVLMGDRQSIKCVWLKWGFYGYKEKQTVFNARSESVLEKRMFQESVLHRRIVIPAAWFYEWNRSKEKIEFLHREAPVLFMAGCWKRFEDGDRFVIITTQANGSVQPVHDRMPLMIEREEIRDWILDGSKTEEFLYRTPAPLRKRADYEQQTFFV